MKKLLPRFEHPYKPLEKSPLEYIDETFSGNAMAFAPILNTTYAKDKNNKAISWKTHDEVMEYLNKAQLYYDENPTWYNLQVLNNFKKASKMSGMVPFGETCIGTATLAYGPSQKQYFLNQAFNNDKNNGFELVKIIGSPSHIGSMRALNNAWEFERFMNLLESQRYKPKYDYMQPRKSVFPTLRWVNLDPPSEEHPMGIGYPVWEDTYLTNDNGMFNLFYDGGWDMSNWLWDRYSKIKNDEDSQTFKNINSSAKRGDMVLFVKSNESTNYKPVPTHATVYLGDNTLGQGHGDVGEDIDKKLYENFYLSPNEQIYIWRHK